jgi:hypothetical protein
MLFQIDFIKEFQFLFYLIPVILGLQLAFYFLYQYRKNKDVNLKLNRILLSFGLFILLMVFGALIIQIARNFVIDLNLQGVIFKIGWAMAFFSPIGLEIFILTEDFAKITNIKLVKILMALNLIAIVLAIIAPSTRSPLFIIAIILVLLNGVNVLRFEVLLITNSVGKIKKKFIEFFIGTITSLTAIFFAIIVGLGLLRTFEFELITYYIGIAFLLSGFIIIFFSAVNFPPFYEFEWRDNLSRLYIINGDNNQYLYYYDFTKNPRKGTIERRRDRLFSGGIIGIDTIISNITDTRDQKLGIIKHDNSYVLLEYGTRPFNIIFALMIKKELTSIQHLLKRIKNQFESFYREILLNLNSIKGNQALLFGSFDVILKGIIQ